MVGKCALCDWTYGIENPTYCASEGLEQPLEWCLKSFFDDAPTQFRTITKEEMNKYPSEPMVRIRVKLPDPFSDPISRVVPADEPEAGGHLCK